MEPLSIQIHLFNLLHVVHPRLLHEILNKIDQAFDRLKDGSAFVFCWKLDFKTSVFILCESPSEEGGFGKYDNGLLRKQNLSDIEMGRHVWNLKRLKFEQINSFHDLLFESVVLFEGSVLIQFFVARVLDILQGVEWYLFWLSHNIRIKINRFFKTSPHIFDLYFLIDCTPSLGDFPK